MPFPSHVVFLEEMNQQNLSFCEVQTAPLILLASGHLQKAELTV